MKAPSDVYESWLFRKEEWAFFLEQAARPHVEDALVEGAEVAGRDMSRALDVTMAIDLDVSDPRIAELINEKLHKFSFEVNEETTRLLKKEFTEAITEGENVRMIRKRVEKVFGFTKRVRTERIARTEIIGTYNRGSYEGMVESGVVDTKRWLATRDSRTRERHKEMDGEVVKLDEKFSNGLLHPGDWDGAAEEIINCRCTMIVEDFIEGE
jgi:SPP1 gp7 family putative phage head morphogenesis protein